MLDSVDHVGVIAFGIDWISPYITGYNCQIASQNTLITDECRIINATDQNKIVFNRFIDSLVKINGMLFVVLFENMYYSRGISCFRYNQYSGCF